jgi:hypothetical protein
MGLGEMYLPIGQTALAFFLATYPQLIHRQGRQGKKAGQIARTYPVLLKSRDPFCILPNKIYLIK